MTSIYKTFTAVLDGEKQQKNDPRIHLLGTLDELNSHLGLVKAKTADDADKKFLESIQVNITRIMSHVSDAENKNYFFTEKELIELDIEISKLKTFLPEKCGFVLPGKTELNALTHIARTVTRRAERYYVTAGLKKMLCLYAGQYLNKLSDYLFALSFK